jgi:hypothetical protein
MRKPSDISEEFEGSWEAFLELPQTKGRDVRLLGECFRILLQQAGIKCPLMNSLGDFFTVKSQYSSLLRRINMAYLLYHMLPVKHTYSFVMNQIKIVNILDGFTVKGQVKLKPQRFELKYLLERMKTLRVFDEIPEQFISGKYPSSDRAVRDRDFIVIYRDANMLVELTRIKGDKMVMRYEVYFKDVIPLYPNLEKQLFALWRRATLGDFR